MLIKVTQGHIDLGEKDQCNTCPVALAVREAGFKSAWVGTRETDIRLSEERTVCITNPPVVVEFITEFDAGRRVSPFEFNLEIPTEATIEHRV